MRYLAIDFGAKRTGLAVGDDVVRIAGPVEVIVTTDQRQRLLLIAKAAQRQGADALVVGLPLNMDGSEGPAALECRTQALQLGEQCGLPVHLVDERLTTAEANEKMSRSGLTRGMKQARRDALAAATILQQFLESR